MGSTGHMPLCLVQHDDRSDAELRDERYLIELNQAICERDAGCRFIFTRQHFDADIEPHWQKLLAVRAALDAGCEHAVWLDSDVGLHTSRPLKLLDSFQGRPVFANSDPPPDLTPRFFQNVRAPVPGTVPRTAAMNAGIWGVANSVRGRALLDAWIGLYPAQLWTVQRKRVADTLADGSTGVGSDCIITRPEPTATSRFAKLRALSALLGGRREGGAPAAATATAATAAANLPEKPPEQPPAIDYGVATEVALKSPAERALERTEERMRASGRVQTASEKSSLARRALSLHIGCQEGTATYVRDPAAQLPTHHPPPPPTSLPEPTPSTLSPTRALPPLSAAQSFHDKWTCSGSIACDVWANSDAFEQGSFALHMLGSPTWRQYITMADARVHNAPCADFTEAERRSALACHFLAEYKDQIPAYINSRTAAATVGAKGVGHVTLAASAQPSADLLSSQIGPMLRIFSERVAPYFSLAVHEAARPQITSTLCHVGAGDGSLASQIAGRLRLSRVHAVDASAMPEAPEALVQSFNGRELPMLNSSCDVTVFAYTLHRPAAAHLTSQLLREARRVTRGYLLLAEDRAGRTVDENERNAALEPHGTFRSEREWREVLAAAGFEVHASGSMFAPSAPQIYFIARPAESATSATA